MMWWFVKAILQADTTQTPGLLLKRILGGGPCMQLRGRGGA